MVNADGTADFFAQDLGDGLALRRGSAQDAAALADFNSRIHSDDGPDKPDMGVAAWTSDLLLKPHPSFRPQDFLIVEDGRDGKIVSSANLISQSWSYAGVRFGVGRVELVGTLPEYRRRGLVRAQFALLHQWSAARGELAQAITGIPFYYRQFGYELALNLGGGWAGNCALAPALAMGAPEPYRLRLPGEQDLPWMLALYRQACRRYLVCCDWDEAQFRYELFGKSQGNINRLEWRVIEDLEAGAVGLLACYQRNWDGARVAKVFELLPGVSFAAVTPTVMRYLCERGREIAAAEGKPEPFGLYSFQLGEGHPLYAALPGAMPQPRRPYAWYMRVPDLPAFIRRVAPVLQQRLADSAFCGHNGELKLSFYRSGLYLRFEQGKLAQVEPWLPQPHGHSGDVCFPGLTFLQLLFGYRTLEQLSFAFADCWWDNDSAIGLLSALFPRLPSDVMGVA